MKRQDRISSSPLYLLISWLFSALFASAAAAADLGVPQLSEPLQKEKFFDSQRVSITGSERSSKPVLEPQLSVSHEAREEEMGAGVKQTTHRVHGEAGGKLNIIGDVSLTAVARIPIYTHEITGTRNSDGVANSELLKNTGRFSWRSELGVPLKEGVNLNFFYDNSTFGRIERPGVDEREEKFGTRFIFKFK